MTFDPFGDFETRGYLRNAARTKDSKIVRQMEHLSFTTGLDAAFEKLAARKQLSYDDVLGTHKVLFDAVYPWAGQDRMVTAPRLVVSKRNDRSKISFAYPQDIRRAVDYALDRGQDKKFMVAKPGEVMGYLAHGHPFLDGNGRTIMVLHCVLAQRAGFSIDWAATSKNDYLAALTKELEEPGKGYLDAYIKPFIKSAVSQSGLAANVTAASGLDGEGAEVRTSARLESEKRPPHLIVLRNAARRNLSASHKRPSKRAQHSFLQCCRGGGCPEREN